MSRNKKKMRNEFIAKSYHSLQSEHQSPPPTSRNKKKMRKKKMSAITHEHTKLRVWIEFLRVQTKIK